MAQQSKADSFSAYLGAWEQSKASAPASSAASTLLRVLAAADQKQMALDDLLTASGLKFMDFGEALQSLLKSGYVTLSGSPSAEIVKLTPLGEDVARLAGSK